MTKEKKTSDLGSSDLGKMQKELSELKEKRILGNLPDGSLIRKKRREIAKLIGGQSDKEEK